MHALLALATLTAATAQAERAVAASRNGQQDQVAFERVRSTKWAAGNENAPGT